MVKVTLPEMGESVTEGSIVEWRRRVGDFVTEGDALVDVTTDKVDVEVPATASGVITQILAGEGDTVSVGSVLAEIDTSKSNGQATAPATPTLGASNGGMAAPSLPPIKTQAPPPAAAPVGEALADQPARRMARRLDVDLARVRGSGPNGLILRSDVIAQAAGAKRRLPVDGALAAVAAPIPAGAALTPLKGPAAALAAYMEQSLTIPTATSFRALAVDVLDARRKELNGAIKAAGRTENVSFTQLTVHHLLLPA
jgi:2-oxoglutarate decarboxylase